METTEYGTIIGMDQNQVRQNVGNQAILNSRNDIGIVRAMRHYYETKEPVTIIKLTKGGMAFVRDLYGKEFSVPPTNLDLKRD